MKIVSDRQKLAGKLVGKRVVQVILDQGETLLSIRPNGFYRLGGQLDDVVGSHVLEDVVPVTWCSIEQKWVE